MAVIIKVIGVRSHARDGIALFVISHAEFESAFLESSITLVDKKKIGLGIVGDENVHPPIAAEIRDGDSHAFAHGLADAARLGYILKASVPKVVIKPGFNTFVSSWTAVLLPFRVHKALPVGLRGPGCVIGDEEIQPSIVRSEERRVGKECRSRWSPYH